MDTIYPQIYQNAGSVCLLLICEQGNSEVTVAEGVAEKGVWKHYCKKESLSEVFSCFTYIWVQKL